MMFWNVCTNYDYVSLINSKLCWNCMNLLKLIKRIRSLTDCQRLKIMEKRTVEQQIKSRNFQARNERRGSRQKQW